jgi:hypothetical protein
MTQIDRWSWVVHCQICTRYCCSGLNWFDWLIRCNRNHQFVISVWLCSLPWPCFQLGSLAFSLQIESWLQLTCFVFIDMTCLHSSSSCYHCQHLVNWRQVWSFFASYVLLELDRACNVAAPLYCLFPNSSSKNLVFALFSIQNSSNFFSQGLLFEAVSCVIHCFISTIDAWALRTVNVSAFRWWKLNFV